MISPERWIANLVDLAGQIADKDWQERRWLAPDRYAWERPEETINAFLDDCVFDGFLEQYSGTFSETQLLAAEELNGSINHFCDVTPQNLDPVVVLADPLWDAVRQKAKAFSDAFKDKWPPISVAVESN